MWAKFLNLGLVDYVRGFVTAAFAAVVAIVLPLLEQLSKGAQVVFPSWETILYVALSAGLAYLVKNLLTNSKDQMFKAEPK